MTAAEHIADVQRRVQSFADDMRAQGIHVGLGNPGRCATCGEMWPCAASTPDEVDEATT